jgi:tetratricopeptide (TPR) repeat protein
MKRKIDIIRKLTSDRLTHIVLLVIAGVLLYGHTLGFEFVWDDKSLIANIDAYRQFDLKKIFFSLPNGFEYLPVRDLSFALDFLIWGDGPMGLHLTNVILYILGAILIYLFTEELCTLLFHRNAPTGGPDKSFLAFATALLFLAHPLHVQTVSFLSCRNVLLSGLFFFASILCYMRFLRTASRAQYAYSLLLFVLAILSKATVIILPLALALLYIPGARYKKPYSSLAHLIPFLVVSAGAYIMFREVAMVRGLLVPESAMIFGSYGYASRGAVSLQIPLFYLWKLIVPVGLSAEYAVNFQRELFSVMSLASAAALAAMLIISIYLRRRYRELIFIFLWYMVALIPVLNFFLTNPVVADRYVYLGSYGFVFLIALAVTGRYLKINPRTSLSALFVLALIWGSQSYMNTHTWQNNITLWEDTARKSPALAKAHSNLAKEYYIGGQHERAFEVMREVERLNPSDIAPQFLRASLLFDRGEFASASRVLEDAARTKRHSLESRFLLGESYLKTGNTDKAMSAYLYVIGSKDLDTHDLKGRARLGLKRARESAAPRLAALKQSALQNPDDPNARVRYSIALDNAGMYAEAARNYLYLDTAEFAHSDLYFNLGNVYKKLNNTERAIHYYRRSVELNPGNLNALNNLALMLKNTGLPDEAIATFKKAMEADANFGHAPFNLAVLYFNLGHRDNALRYFRYVSDKFPSLKAKASAYMMSLDDQTNQ